MALATMNDDASEIVLGPLAEGDLVDPYLRFSGTFFAYLDELMKLKLSLFVGGIFLFAAFKKDVAPGDPSRAVDPPHTVQNTGTVIQPGATNVTAVAAETDVPVKEQPTTDNPKPALVEMTEDEAAGYHKTCHFILNRMVECANDPGFNKYQKRWSEKGAPSADSKGFEKRILAWKGNDARNVSCKAWSRMPGTREHFAITSKLNTVRDDAKLTCEFFGQELDDDGWFPAVLMVN